MWEERKGETYVEMLTLVQQIMSEVNDWRDWVGDYGPVRTPAADLAAHQRATIQRVQVWGSSPIRDMLADLQHKFHVAERGYMHHEAVVAQETQAGREVSPNFNLENVAATVNEMDEIADKIERAVRAELQPASTRWSWRRRRVPQSADAIEPQ